jgi:hypothetical protein
MLDFFGYGGKRRFGSLRMKKFKLAGTTWDSKATSMPDLGTTNPDEAVIFINDKLRTRIEKLSLAHELFMQLCLRWVSVTMTSDL